MKPLLLGVLVFCILQTNACKFINVYVMFDVGFVIRVYDNAVPANLLQKSQYNYNLLATGCKNLGTVS